ncbi:MAG TPA: nuclear transport factor 2 family protein [Longilinea sp.]|nr:nuclear transport factor 2 family protein [Longilinea sp.]
MSILQQNEAAARRCVDMFNKGNINAWIETCYAKDAQWIELPRQSTPEGQQGGPELIRSSGEAVLKLAPNRRMTIHSLVAQNDQVVLEIDWQGTTVAPMGNIPAGFTFRYRVATILTFVDGLIVKEVDYCIPLRSDAEWL